MIHFFLQRRTGSFVCVNDELLCISKLRVMSISDETEGRIDLPFLVGRRMVKIERHYNVYLINSQPGEFTIIPSFAEDSLEQVTVSSYHTSKSTACNSHSPSPLPEF